MGTGRFKNGKFDLTVVANHVISAADLTEWERSLKKASELFMPYVKRQPLTTLHEMDPDKWHVDTTRREPAPDHPIKSAKLRPRR